MSNPVFATFESIIQVGILNSVAITNLSENQTSEDFKTILKPNSKLVFHDIECSSFDEWIDTILHEGHTMKKEGTYKVCGRAKFDEDSSDYFALRITKMEQK
ncbi:TPA: hypothetical protein I7730_00110 [Vibrio vulnificus]|uniref:Uncharacterized protein n=1 Tax=Vibrio vulnificus TaxID=672 RepID=A0A8H9MY23_VIBVL|nr:hypothetical protein [Vibrio vulnificus]HAS8538201.1 hypothetical protein [Vibrio vulnificus]